MEAPKHNSFDLEEQALEMLRAQFHQLVHNSNAMQCNATAMQCAFNIKDLKSTVILRFE